MLTNLCQTSILSANSHGDLDVVYLKTAACMTLASLKDRFVSMPPGKMFTTRLLAAPLTRCMWAEPHFCYCCCYATPTMENQFGRSDDWWSPHLCWTYVMLEAKESELRTSWTFYLFGCWLSVRFLICGLRSNIRTTASERAERWSMSYSRELWVKEWVGRYKPLKWICSAWRP